MSEEIEEFDTSFKEQPVCPYCGYQESVEATSDIGSDVDREYCSRCDKIYAIEQEHTRTFCSYKTCQPGDEHLFNEWQHYLGERWTRYCKICSSRQWKKV